MSIFEAFREELTGWIRPGHDRGCKPVEVIPGLWIAHYDEIDSLEKVQDATKFALLAMMVNSAVCQCASRDGFYAPDIKFLEIDIEDDPDDSKYFDQGKKAVQYRSRETGIESKISSVTNTLKKESVTNTEVDAEDIQKKETRGIMKFACMNSMKVLVLCVLCLQNSMFTILRRYSQGVLKEVYSKHEVLLVGEVIKMAFSAWMITGTLPEGDTIFSRITYLINKSRKMFVLAAIYGAMNILSYVSLRNIGAGIFTIFAQCKILTTATFSSIILKHKYSWAQWRAMVSLMLGVLLFTAPVWNNLNVQDGGNAFIGTAAVLIEVTLSGFASIYFEKVIKTDPEQIGIWERNFQLALGSCPIYLMFIISNHGDEAGFLGGWTPTAWILAFLGSAGGLLVALSIKYGDSILKTLATTGAIILSSVLDYAFLDGPLTPVMCIAGTQVIIAIANYTFDYPPPPPESPPPSMELNPKRHDVDNDNELVPLVNASGLTGRILNSPGSGSAV